MLADDRDKLDSNNLRKMLELACGCDEDDWPDSLDHRHSRLASPSSQWCVCVPVLAMVLCRTDTLSVFLVSKPVWLTPHCRAYVLDICDHIAVSDIFHAPHIIRNQPRDVFFIVTRAPLGYDSTNICAHGTHCERRNL